MAATATLERPARDNPPPGRRTSLVRGGSERSERTPRAARGVRGGSERSERTPRADGIVAGLRGRDPRALERLTARYGRMIASWASSEGPDAEDVVQEVLFRVWRYGPRLAPNTSLPPFLKTVTQNALRDRWRSRGRKPAVPMGLELPAATPGDPTARENSRIAVEQIMDTLGSRDREVLRMLYLSDLSLEDVAGRLNLSEDAAKSLAARARRRMRAKLEKLVATSPAATLALLVGRAAEALTGALAPAGLAGLTAGIVAVSAGGAAVQRDRPAAPVRAEMVAAAEPQAPAQVEPAQVVLTAAAAEPPAPVVVQEAQPATALPAPADPAPAPRRGGRHDDPPAAHGGDVAPEDDPPGHGSGPPQGHAPRPPKQGKDEEIQDHPPKKEQVRRHRDGGDSESGEPGDPERGAGRPCASNPQEGPPPQAEPPRPQPEAGGDPCADTAKEKDENGLRHEEDGHEEKPAKEGAKKK